MVSSQRSSHDSDARSADKRDRDDAIPDASGRRIPIDPADDEIDVCFAGSRRYAGNGRHISPDGLNRLTAPYRLVRHLAQAILYPLIVVGMCIFATYGGEWGVTTSPSKPVESFSDFLTRGIPPSSVPTIGFC